MNRKCAWRAPFLRGFKEHYAKHKASRLMPAVSSPCFSLGRCGSSLKAARSIAAQPMQLNLYLR